MAAKARAAVSGAAIAADALRYRGVGYVYAGTGSRPGDWDCSSFISYVLGHDLGLKLPGGQSWLSATSGGRSHGPVVEDYAAWGIPTDSPRLGDMVCWIGAGPGGHIGIVLGANKMISALDTAQGTLVTPIIGFGPAAPMVYRQVPATTAGGGGYASGGGAYQSGGGVAAAMLAGALVVAGMAGLILAGAAVAGVAVVAGTAWAARRVSQ